MTRLVFAVFFLSVALTGGAAPVKVIFDTDMLTDFDDVGALSCLHALADAGECEILATVSCTRGNASVAAIEIINSYYGRSDIPVGCTKGAGIVGDVGCRNGRKATAEEIAATMKRGKEKGDGGHYKYRKLAADYPHWVRHADSDDAPDAVEVYRRVLAAQPDKSVVICSVGFLTNLRLLLQSKGDAHSPLDGRELVARKVKTWVAMCCKYMRGKEYNSMMDPESSRVALSEWPTKVVISDFEFGVDTYAGRAVAEMSGPRNPVKDVFAGSIPTREQVGADPVKWQFMWFGMGGRAAWDETAVLAAVRGETSYFNVRRGEYRMVGEDGENVWVPDEENGRHLRLTEKVGKPELGRIIDELICRGPARSVDAVAVYCPDPGPLKPFAGGKRLRPRTGVVKPENPAHVETEIEVAANAGIGVFLVRGEIPVGFLTAKNRDRMKVIRLADAAVEGYADLPGHDLDRNAGLTPEAYAEKLAAAKAEAQAKGLKGVFVGSWNDYGHGRFLVPDDRENDYYLRAVAKVFGRRPSNVYATCSSADPRNPATAHPELQRMRAPDLENVAYGTDHLRQRMDVWLPKGVTGKVPCVIVIHGGAWVDGCSMAMARGMVTRGDASGVAVVTISYRTIPDADAAKHVPPIEWPMEDAERAVRFVLAHADDWNIDATRIGLTGGSAGATTALYLGLMRNNELGIRAVKAGVPQTTLDPEEARRWVPGAFYPAHGFGYGYTDGAALLRDRAKWLPWIERYSAAGLVRKVDPARAPKIFLSGNPLPMPGEKPAGGVVHSGAYCHEFKKVCDAQGVFCVRGTDEEFIAALRNDVADPFDFVRARLAAGEKRIVVPRGVYRVAAKGPVYLRLERAKDVTVDFSGSRLLCTTKTRVIELKNCTNVTVRALTVDYDPMTFTQAIIEKVDADRNWDVRIVPGYPCPAAEDLASVWPVQVYARKDLELKNPNRYRDNIAVARTGPDTYRITGGVDRTGDVGDVCVWSVNPTKPGPRGVVESEDCVGCRIEDLTAYATPDGCVCSEKYSHGATYRNVRLVRCPEAADFDFRAMKRVRSGNHDAFNARFGDTVTLDGCEFAYHCDDSINISGYYSIVTKCEGNRIRVLPAFGRWGLFAPGDTIQIMTFEGLVPPDAKVLKVEEAGPATDEERRRVYATNLREPCLKAVKTALTLTLDRPVDFSFGTVVIANERMGNGFVIRNCRFGSTRARAMLIKASNGLIENNTVERSHYDAISIYPEYYWLEGGCSRNVTIRNNVLRNNGGGIWIGGSSGNGRKLPPEAHPGMVLENNVIVPRKKETK